MTQTRTQSLLLSAKWLWVGFDEFAVHQGKDGGSIFLPPSQKALHTLITFPYCNAKMNK